MIYCGVCGAQNDENSLRCHSCDAMLSLPNEAAEDDADDLSLSGRRRGLARRFVVGAVVVVGMSLTLAALSFTPGLDGLLGSRNPQTSGTKVAVVPTSQRPGADGPTAGVVATPTRPAAESPTGRPTGATAVSIETPGIGSTPPTGTPQPTASSSTPTTLPIATPQVTATAPDVRPTGRILFSSNRRNESSSDERDIYLVRLNGSGLERLTAEFGYDGQPSWAPTGQRIAFVSERTSVRQVWVMDTDGGHPEQLTDGADPSNNPDWAPGGTVIAYAHGSDDDAEIWTMSPDGSNRQRLTRNDRADAAPAWSPAGDKIIFMGKQGRHWQIYLMNADGSDVRQITSDPSHHRYPRFLPDGRRIVYNTLTDSDDPEVGQIYIANEDGTRIRQLTTQSQGRNGRPFPSPDGRYIAFNSDRRSDNFEIYMMRPDGSEPRRLTFKVGNDFEPAWSP